MANINPCEQCGGAMVQVQLAGTDDRPALVRDNFGHFFSRDAIVYLEKAHACGSCGYTRLYTDPDKLRRAMRVHDDEATRAV